MCIRDRCRHFRTVCEAEAKSRRKRDVDDPTAVHFDRAAIVINTALLGSPVHAAYESSLKGRTDLREPSSRVGKLFARWWALPVDMRAFTACIAVIVGLFVVVMVDSVIPRPASDKGPTSQFVDVNCRDTHERASVYLRAEDNERTRASLIRGLQRDQG